MLQPAIFAADSLRHKETARQFKHADHDRLSELAGAIQWRLRHGRSCQAIRKLEIMQMVLGFPSVVDKESVKLIRRLTKELLGYLHFNRGCCRRPKTEPLIEAVPI